MPTHERSLGRKALIALVAFVIMAGGGIALRMHSAFALRHDTDEAAITSVAVVKPAPLASEEELILPGDVQAWHQATIYARTNGYVKRWLTPMGTHVKEGELLAEIETPELDAQLRQAEADLKTAEANNALAQLTAERWKALLKTDSVSKQEEAEKEGDAMAKAAALAAAKANRDHLQELVSFKQVVAPFEGTITARLTDVGMLVESGGATAQQQPLFRIVQSDRLRVYVRVPEGDAGRINPDVSAELHLAEHPTDVYKATLYKSAEAIDPTNRTLLIEFLVENKEGKLFSGGYAEVHIKIPSEKKVLRLPVNALIFRAGGLQVATVDANNRAVIKPVTMGRDYGNVVEISSGITEEDKVIINPPDSIANGQELKIIEPKKTVAEKDNGKS